MSNSNIARVSTVAIGIAIAAGQAIAGWGDDHGGREHRKSPSPHGHAAPHAVPMAPPMSPPMAPMAPYPIYAPPPPAPTHAAPQPSSSTPLPSR